MTHLHDIKPPVEFHHLDMTTEWEPAPGAADGVEQKMLSGSLDETEKVGVRTRLIRFQPGAVAPNQFVHDYWEEVYLLDGTLITGCNPDGTGGTAFDAPCFACRPPGTYHGPFASPDGCVFFEIQYYA
jgi:ChrR-like protein with cupin domain